MYQRFYVELTNNPDLEEIDGSDPKGSHYSREYNINLKADNNFMRVQFTKVKKETEGTLY